MRKAHQLTIASSHNQKPTASPPTSKLPCSHFACVCSFTPPTRNKRARGCEQHLQISSGELDSRICWYGYGKRARKILGPSHVALGFSGIRVSSGVARNPSTRIHMAGTCKYSSQGPAVKSAVGVCKNGARETSDAECVS